VKAEFHLDLQEFATVITEVLRKELRVLLAKKTVATESLLTVKTLAQYLHVSEQWVYERVHLKEIPCIKMGKFPRFKQSDIDKWLETLTTPAVQPLSHPVQERRTKTAAKSPLTERLSAFAHTGNHATMAASTSAMTGEIRLTPTEVCTSTRRRKSDDAKGKGVV
jgi:excisionase family DNA binding protein